MPLTTKEAATVQQSASACNSKEAWIITIKRPIIATIASIDYNLQMGSCLHPIKYICPIMTEQEV